MGFFVGLLVFFLPSLAVAATVEVTIEGVSDALLENVQAYLSLEQQKKRPNLSPAQIKRLHRQAPVQIKQALQPFGYYQTQVLTELTPPTDEDPRWRARYRIELGSPVMIARLDLKLSGSGRKDPPFQALLADYPVNAGEPLSHLSYEQGKQRLQNLADARGYFEARFTTSTLRIDLAANEAHVVLHFHTGPRYRFGAVSFDQDLFDEALLRRYLTFTPGEFYSLKAVSQLRANLDESGYFETVRIDTQRDPERQRVALEVIPVLRKPNRYRARIGYGTDTDVRVRLNWERRYLNRYGHQLSVGLSAKREQDELGADINYLVPLGRSKDDYLVATLSYESKELTVDDTDVIVAEAQERLNFGATRSDKLSFRISKHRQRQLFGNIPLEQIVSLEYFTEDYNLLEILPDELAMAIETFLPQVEPVFDADFELLMPGLSWSYARANRQRYTTQGEQVDFGIRGARDGFGSNLSFWQARLSGMLVRKLGKQGRVIVRSDVGYTDANTVSTFNLNILPESLQFKVGGDRSVRGYGFEEIDVGGLGGKHLLVSSVEYEHRVFDSWGIAAFYDTGDVFNKFSNVELKEGAGAGIRWYSPLGPIRLDIASGLSKDGNPLRVHFSVGSDF